MSTLYKQKIIQSIERLAKDPMFIAVGYNTKFGNRALGTLENVPDEKIIETPVAENLMTGIAIGLSLQGYKPLLYFERFDFILNALDQIVNHLDKISRLSNGEFNPKVIIRVIIGNKKKPFFSGETHTQDFTQAMREMITFPIFKPLSPNEVIYAYGYAEVSDESVMIIETKDLM